MSAIKHKLHKLGMIGALKMLVLSVVLALGLTAPAFAFKAPAVGGGGTSSSNVGSSSQKGVTEDPAVQCSNNDCDLIAKYVEPTINLLSGAFGLIAVISLILGGINYTTSEGDPQKSSRAKKRIFDTIIAVVAYLFLYSFLQFLIPGGAFNR